MVHAAVIVSARSMKPQKEPNSGRLNRLPLLTALLSAQRAASIRCRGVQVVELDATAMPFRSPAARSQARAATSNDAGTGTPLSLGGPNGGASPGNRRAITSPWCVGDGSNKTQEKNHAQTPSAHRARGPTVRQGGARGPCARWPLSRRAQVPPESTL